MGARLLFLCPLRSTGLSSLCYFSMWHGYFSHVLCAVPASRRFVTFLCGTVTFLMSFAQYRPLVALLLFYVARLLFLCPLRSTGLSSLCFFSMWHGYFSYVLCAVPASRRFVTFLCGTVTFLMSFAQHRPLVALLLFYV